MYRRLIVLALAPVFSPPRLLLQQKVQSPQGYGERRHSAAGQEGRTCSHIGVHPIEAAAA